MSFIGDFIAGIESQITANLPTYTLLTTVRALSSIPPDQYPAAMVANPGFSSDRLDFQQNDMEVEAQVFLLRTAGDAAQLRTDLETLWGAIDNSSNLGGVVDDAWVREGATDETQQSRVVAGLVVHGKRVA